jgi:rSAM/selenodomain-associated transferase 1
MMPQPAGRQVVVLAKAPSAGRAKTRLSPPCGAEDAAVLAEAALRDTLAAVERTRCARRVLALEGKPGPWVPFGFDVIPQRGDGLDQRLAAAFNDAGAPSLLIGMDTPQVSSSLLGDALGKLERPDVDAVLGRAEDGGWWAIGLRRADPRVFLGVPMSTSETGRWQEGRLRVLGLRWLALPVLRDVDRFGDAVAVAELIPGSRFASAVRRVRASLLAM